MTQHVLNTNMSLIHHTTTRHRGGRTATAPGAGPASSEKTDELRSTAMQPKHRIHVYAMLTQTHHSTIDVSLPPPTQFDINHASPLRTVSVNRRFSADFSAVRHTLAKSKSICIRRTIVSRVDTGVGVAPATPVWASVCKSSTLSSHLLHHRPSEGSAVAMWQLTSGLSGVEPCCYMWLDIPNNTVNIYYKLTTATFTLGSCYTYLVNGL